jgi:hypothetical protein
MAYTVNQLITNAYYLSQIVSRDLDQPTGNQITLGLNLLNALLSFKTSDGKLVPYYQLQSYTLTAGIEQYFYPNLIWVESITFNIGPIRYSMMNLDRKKYFGSSRIDNLETLPFSYRTERTLNGTNIYYYFIPADNYPIHIMGKYSLTNVTNLALDLETIYDDFYIEYLRYGLGEMICNDYGVDFLPQNALKLKQYEHRLRSTNTPDLTICKQTTFTSQPGINYGDINIGKGWRPNA